MYIEIFKHLDEAELKSKVTDHERLLIAHGYDSYQCSKGLARMPSGLDNVDNATWLWGWFLAAEKEKK